MDSTYAERLRYLRMHRALLIMDAFHQRPEKDPCASLGDALTTVAIACGRETYDVIRAGIDGHDIPIPGSAEWPSWFIAQDSTYMATITGPRQCPICHGEMTPGVPTARVIIGGSSGPAFYGPARHQTCPDVRDLPRCPDCRGIVFPLPRGPLHAAGCTEARVRAAS